MNNGAYDQWSNAIRTLVYSSTYPIHSKNVDYDTIVRGSYTHLYVVPFDLSFSVDIFHNSKDFLSSKIFDNIP